jgi:hypothetical protein
MGADILVKREVAGHMRTSAASSASAITRAVSNPNAMGSLSALLNGLSIAVQGACRA